MSGGTKLGYEVGELRVCFLKRLEDWILKYGFCVSLLNRLIQDHLDHGASKELKNPRPEWILQFL